MDAPTIALVIGAILIRWAGSGSLLAIVRALTAPYAPPGNEQGQAQP